MVLVYFKMNFETWNGISDHFDNLEDFLMYTQDYIGQLEKIDFPLAR